jgi:hypothetical protein
MQIPEFPFTAIDWASVSAEAYPGESGTALWRTVMVGDMRVRMVEYSPNYFADHWCARGHVILIVEGEMIAELKDGSEHRLTKGMGYIASDDTANPHRSRTAAGCKLFIVD